jgi:hypothetical protein
VIILKYSSAVQEHRNRSVVDQLDGHHGPEFTLSHMTDFILCFLDEVIAKRPGAIRILRPGKRGPSPLPAIPQKGELGNHQHLPTDIEQRKIHLSFFVIKDPEIHDLVGEIIRIVIQVPLFNPEKNQEAFSDFGYPFVADVDPNSVDPLYYSTHATRLVGSGMLATNPIGFKLILVIFYYRQRHRMK